MRIRLDAFLASAGAGSRSQVKLLIRQGRVRVDGEVCRSSAQQVGGCAIVLDDETLELPPEHMHIAFHKPCGYACSHDIGEAPIVDDLLPDRVLRARVQAAGRLDRDTSGLLILSSDGQLVHRLTHPNRKVEKRYRIRYRGELPPDAVERCALGIVLKGDPVPTRPARLVLADRCTAPLQGRERVATLHLREGRHRQVRRMFAALGSKVVALHRDRIGSYDLPLDLERGRFVALCEEDLLLLRTDSSL